MKSSEFDNRIIPRQHILITEGVGGTSRTPIGVFSGQFLHVQSHVIDRRAHSKKEHHDFDGVGKRVPPPLWYRQIGDGIHHAIGDLLEGTDTFSSFFQNSKPIHRLGRRLREIGRTKPDARSPQIEDFRDASESIALCVADFLSKRYEGREVHHITEASFSPNLPAYQASADRINSLEKKGILSADVSLEFTRPFAIQAVDGLHTQGLDEQTLADLQRVGASTTTRIDYKRGRASTATDWIRPDVLTITYRNNERNQDMPDLLNVLDAVKSGRFKNENGKRANILDFEAWVNEEVMVAGEKMTAAQAMQRFIHKVIAGDAKVIVNEIKTHMNGIRRVRGDIDNKGTKIPYVSFSDLDYDLRRDLAITTDALWRFMGQFEPRVLFDEEVAYQALRNTRTVLIDINLNALRPDTKDKAHAKAKDIQEPNPEATFCQIHFSDLLNYWKNRNWEVFYTRETKPPRRKKRKKKTEFGTKVSLEKRDGKQQVMIKQKGQKSRVLETPQTNRRSDTVKSQDSTTAEDTKKDN